MDPQLAADMIDQLQRMPEDKQAHFKLTIVSLMQCYLDPNVTGALLINYENEERSAIISIGIMEEDLIDGLERVHALLTDPDAGEKVMLQ